MDVVLGVVMTSRDARLLLVEGDRGDGAIVDHDSFDAISARGAGRPGFSEDVVSAVLGTYASAAAKGHIVRRVAVCWTDAVEAEAALVLNSLDHLGITNVVVVPATEAVEGAAGHLADTRTPGMIALCIAEPDVTAVAVACRRAEGDRHVRSQTLTGGGRGAIVRALQGVCTGSVESIVLAGRGPQMGRLVTEVNSVTSRSVTLADDALLLLGRGALLASVGAAVDEPERGTPAVFVPRAARPAMIPGLTDEADATAGPRSPRLAKALSGVLAAAVLTFVVSISLAIAQQFTSTDDDRPTETQVAKAEPAPTEPAPPGPVEPPTLMALPEQNPIPAAPAPVMAAGPQLPQVAPPIAAPPVPAPVQGALQQVAQQVLPPAIEVAKNPITVPNTDITLPPLTDIVAQYRQ
jgi:hypothetical protein